MSNCKCFYPLLRRHFIICHLFFFLAEVRKAMFSYWEQYEPSIESMMLSQDAQELDRIEKEEILSYLPPIEGRSILELGSGIGYNYFN